jgi:hypothetical protein
LSCFRNISISFETFWENFFLENKEFEVNAIKPFI